MLVFRWTTRSYTSYGQRKREQRKRQQQKVTTVHLISIMSSPIGIPAVFFVVVVVVPTMSDQGSSPLFNLDVDQCHMILDETIALLLLSEQQYPVASPAVNLTSLLLVHFQDDASCSSFRSLFFYGRPFGDTVIFSF